MKMEFDLHCHSRMSDGSCEPEEVVRQAARAGLSGIALTDHDTAAGIGRAGRAGKQLGVEVIPGVEVSTIDPDSGRKFHLLVYAPADLSPLEPLLKRMRESRRECGEEMFRRVSQRIPITREQVSRIGAESGIWFRQHLMQAAMELGYTPSIFGELYHELFSREGGCLVPPKYTGLEEALPAAKRTGGVLVAAHPGVYRSIALTERLAREGWIDGLEFDYPRRKDEEIPELTRIAEKYGLIRTAGTDFHGYYAPCPHPIGSCRAGEETVGRILALSAERKEMKDEILLQNEGNLFDRNPD